MSVTTDPLGRQAIGPHRTPGFEFTVTVPDAALAARVSGLLAALRVVPQCLPAPRTAVFELRPDGDGWALLHDDAVLVTQSTPDVVLDHLQWNVNQQVVAETQRRTTSLHAAGVQHSGTTVLLPGTSGSGKSTLAMGLVRAGWRYLSDEAVALDPDSLDALAYPKPFSVGGHARSLFPELGLPVSVTGSYLVPAADVSPAWEPGPGVPDLLVFPRFVAGAEPDLTAMTPGSAVMALAECTFAFNTAGARHLPLLARLARRCPAYRLVSGDLTDAVRAVEGLVRTGG